MQRAATRKLSLKCGGIEVLQSRLQGPSRRVVARMIALDDMRTHGANGMIVSLEVRSQCTVSTFSEVHDSHHCGQINSMVAPNLPRLI